MIRRSLQPGEKGELELAFYRCYAPHPVGLPVLVQVAGRRWTVEQSFQTSKGQTGLDEHQVRTWRSWHRWTTLVLVAHLFLAIATATRRTVPAPAGLIPLTLNEFRHLFAALVITLALPVRQVGCKKCKSTPSLQSGQLTRWRGSAGASRGKT